MRYIYICVVCTLALTACLMCSCTVKSSVKDAEDKEDGMTSVNDDIAYMQTTSMHDAEDTLSEKNSETLQMVQNSTKEIVAKLYSIEDGTEEKTGVDVTLLTFQRIDIDASDEAAVYVQLILRSDQSIPIQYGEQAESFGIGTTVRIFFQGEMEKIDGKTVNFSDTEHTELYRIETPVLIEITDE